MAGSITAATLARIDKIKATWQPGDSASIIARRLGVSRAAIIGMFDRHAHLLKPARLNEKQVSTRVRHKKVAKPKEPKAPKAQRVPNNMKRAYALLEPPAPLPVFEHLDSPPSLNLTLMELTMTTCKWAYGDRTITFCGHHIRDEKSSYCPYHKRLMHAPRRA